MAYNDYIILIDENGSPYIAHKQVQGTDASGGGTGKGRWWNTWKNRVTKYKEKIPLGNGKFRYVYDETTKKVGSGIRKAKKNFDRNVLGSSAKITRDVARQNYTNAARGGQSSKTRALKEAFERSQAAYDKTLMGRAENASRKIRNSKATRTLRKYKNRTLSSIKKAKSKLSSKKNKQTTVVNPGNYKNRQDQDRL